MVSSEDADWAEVAAARIDQSVNVAQSAKAIEPGPFAWAERAASRYFSIWIWSIVVGVATSTTFSLTNYSIRSKGPLLGVLVVPLFALSALALLAGWWGTVRFFDTYILRMFWGSRPGNDDLPPEALAERDYEVRYYAGQFLRTAVRWTFIGLAFRLLLSLADLLLNTVFY